MQNNLRIMLAALLVSLLLVLTVSCQKKTVAVESGSNSTAQDAGYDTSTADHQTQTPWVIPKSFCRKISSLNLTGRR